MVSSCEKTEPNTDMIPNVPFSLTINLDLPAYTPLKIPGAYRYFPEGARGLIVYHAYDDEYYAFDRNCSYQPSLSCAQLWMDSTTNMNMICGDYVDGTFEKCCDSRFELPTGFPTQGPATLPMKIYLIYESGNTLYVSN